jgi:hypothetical protein
MQVDDAGGNHECSWTWASPGSGAIRTASSTLYTELSDGWSTSSWRRVVHIKAAISITYTSEASSAPAERETLESGPREVGAAPIMGQNTEELFSTFLSRSGSLF